MSNVTEETRTTCPRCKSNSIGPGENVCTNCAKKRPGDGTRVSEMSSGGMTGFQLPLGAKERKDEIEECLKTSGDLNEGHMVAFYSNGNRITEFFDAIDMGFNEVAADIVREEVTRAAVRQKISEVVRKKAGGGGFVLYAPNKGKKKASHPVATFPTKLAAKRAQLARFPPKDPKKLARLRKEIARLMKDPKKRAEAERRAAKQKGTDSDMWRHPATTPRPKKESFDRELVERAIIAEAVNTAIKTRLTEGLFKEEDQPSKWDDYIGKIASNVLTGDRGYRNIQKKMMTATEGALSQALKIIQRQIGGQAKVKSDGQPKFKDGIAHIPFAVVLPGAEVGPIYLYVEKGIPRVEISDQAKNSLTKVEPEMARSIRGALASAEDAVGKVSGVRDATLSRDAYLQKLETQVDRMIAGMSPLQISMLKQLLVKKYRSKA